MIHTNDFLCGLFAFIAKAGSDAPSLKERPGIPAIDAARIFHLETSVLTGASLDKAGSIYPLKRVGIIQWG